MHLPNLIPVVNDGELAFTLLPSQSQSFKLYKAGLNASGKITVGRGLIAVLDAVKKWATDKAKSAGGSFELSKMLTLSPTIKSGDDGLEFDLGLQVALPGMPAMTLDKALSNLPGSVQVNTSRGLHSAEAS
jgi:hypothetical protein